MTQNTLYKKMFDAIRSDDINLVEKLLSNGANASFNDSLLLTESVDINNIDIFKLLVKNGADITASNSRVLRYSATRGHLSFIKYAAEQGVDISIPDNRIIQWASDGGHADIISYCLLFPEVIIESIRLDQKFHTNKNITECIAKMYNEITPDISEADKYTKNKTIKLLTDVQKELYVVISENEINKDEV